MEPILLNVTVLITILCVTILYCKWKFSYWKRKGVPYIEPRFPFGTGQNPLARKVNMGEKIKSQYDQLKSQGHKHGGLYFTVQPIYLPIHTDYIKNIMYKDFQYFHERGFYFNEKDDPLTGNLFCIEGQKWKQCRAKLAPAYASGKIKMMFPTMVACAEQLKQAVEKFADGNKPIDIKTTMEYFTTDCIGSCAFGVDCNCFENPNNEYRTLLKTTFAPPNTYFLAFKNAISFFNRRIAQLLRISIIRPEVTTFFINMAKESLRYREASDIVKNDFMQALIDLKYSLKKNDEKMGKLDSEGLTIKEIAAHTFVFFLGGYETSSIVLSLCLYELAVNQDIQDRLREDILGSLKNHQYIFTYESILEMKYLHQVVDETLRKYPPGILLTRLCTEDYKIPNTDVTIEKGTRILISPLGLHRDPEYYPDPETFNPDRFNEENKKFINPYAYLPFGAGPRNCSGLRFGLMQVRVGLAMVLRHLKFSLNKQTTLPLIIDPDTPIMTIKNIIWLDVERV